MKRSPISDVNLRPAARVSLMIYKAKINKKYPFKQMKVGETFKLNNEDVRGAQVMASYYRKRCKRPIKIVITKRDDGYHCRRMG
jgi:hypothetical protein